MSSLSEFIKQSWLFPVLQSVHILGLTVLVGTIALVDFRLLGVGMRRLSLTQTVSMLAPWTSAGLLTVFVTGPILFWSDMPRYIQNPAFVLKMVLLAVALAAHFTLHRSVVQVSDIKLRQRVIAALSLLLWSSVVLAGRAIADFDIRIA
jgi:hypothetical protein